MIVLAVQLDTYISENSNRNSAIRGILDNIDIIIIAKNFEMNFPKILLEAL